MAQTIGNMAAQVLARLEEPNPANPIFWGLNTEVYSALVEACSDLMLLIGRPTNTVNLPFTIQPNTPFQSLPPGMFCITDIVGTNSSAWKFSLWDFDYAQSNNWGSDWEDDIGDHVLQWAPLGLSSFIVHPSVSVPEPVMITGIQLVTTETWPYDSSVTIPFQTEVESALECYAAHILILKEGGAEFKESMALYQEYLDIAARITEIQDRRDPFIFNRSVGVQAGTVTTTRR